MDGPNILRVDPGEASRIGTSWINGEEAKWAAERYYSFDSGTKAIICYYQAQVDYIKAQFLITDVFTVDGIQGREWEHVIVLVARPGGHPHTVDPGRAQVALTRFKRTMSISATGDWLEFTRPGRAILELGGKLTAKLIFEKFPSRVREEDGTCASLRFRVD